MLSFSYVSFEVYIYVTILKQFSSEKKLKAEMLLKPEGANNFRQHIKEILVPPAEIDDEIKAKHKVLVKFYLDEVTGKELFKESPALGNAFKAILRRDQRTLMYFIALMLIPI